MLIAPAQTVCQETDLEATFEVSPVKSSAVREEVQRYFGYEDLMFRYLTLPYDLNQNVNQKGKHVDFGYVLFALLPLMLLISVYKHKKWFYAIAGFLVLYLGMCFKYSHVVSTSKRLAANPGTDLWTSIQAGSDASFTEKALMGLYDIGILIASPLIWSIDQITGQTDHVTYPLISILFLGMLWIVSKRRETSIKVRLTTLLFIAYAFFWYVTSGGIIWYGFLMFPLIFILLVNGFRSTTQDGGIPVKPLFQYFSIGILSFWLICGYVFRVSDVNLLEKDDTHRGYALMNPIFFLYGTGKIGKEETKNMSAPNLVKAMRTINKDNRRVFQVGTHLILDIKNNNTRVFEDNLLAVFSEEVKKNNSQGLIADALANYGFGYILIDLNVPFMDKTPERSLTEKYKVLLAAVKDNPKMRLVATDRKTIKTINGKKVERFDVFGEGIAQLGNYAVYEIL